MKKYAITIIVIIGIMLVLFSSYYIYSNYNSQDSTDTLKSKVNEEIAYLNTTIISMMNQFNNISYANYKIVEENVPSEAESKESSSSSGQGEQSSGGEEMSEGDSNTITSMNMNDSSILVNPSKTINWDNIKKEIEKMYGTWPTILIDLNALNVNKDNLLKFNSYMDNITQTLEKEDKKASVKNLADLYQLLVLYMKEYSDDTKSTYIYDTKSNILYAYAFAEEDKWDEMKKNIKTAQNAFSNVMNSQLQNNSNITSINKAYVLLNEMEKSTDTKNKNIFYINYKNLMQELEIIEK